MTSPQFQKVFVSFGKFLTLWVVVMAMLCGISDSKCEFEAIFNFGDSNSDTGGFWAAFPAQSGPFGMTYFKRPAGRASDGRLIVDFLVPVLPYQNNKSEFSYGSLQNIARETKSLLLLNTEMGFSNLKKSFHRHEKIHTVNSASLGCGVGIDLRLQLYVAQALGLPFLSPYLQSIGSDYRHGANYATLASTVLLPNTSLFVTGISPFSLAIQLNQMKEFKARVDEFHSSYSSGSTKLPSRDIFGKSLYTFYIGQNDFTSNLAAIGIGGVRQYLPQVASQIAGTVEELYALGGRTFLVLNLAPIGCYPAFLVQLPHSSSDLDAYGCMISYNNAVLDYNNMLKEALAQTRRNLPNASLICVDTHSVLLELFQNPTSHGLKYGTKACCGHGDGAYNFDAKVFCGNTKVINGSSVTATACSDPQDHVSWDGIHATEAANKLTTWAILNGSYFDPPFPLHQLCDLNPIG